MPDDLGLGQELPGFLRSLWEMCCDEAGNGAIRWGKARSRNPTCTVVLTYLPTDASGTRIIIKSHRMMEAKVLSKRPGSTCFTGFQRQLNYFGFRRVFGANKLPGKQKMYANPMFRREHPAELLLIERQDKGKRKCTPAKMQAREEQEAEEAAAALAEAVADSRVPLPMGEGWLPAGLPAQAETGEPVWASIDMVLGDVACNELGLGDSSWCVVL